VERAPELDDGLMCLALDRVAGECPHALLRIVFEHEPEQRCQEQVVPIAAVAERCREAGLELEADARLGVADAEAEEAAQQFAERVVGDLLRVRHALHPQESHLLAPAAPGLGGETALADSRLSGDRDDRPAPVGQLFENLVEHGYFLLAADKRRGAARGPFQLAGEAEPFDGFGLALQREQP
jgi:hypothetical protein